jgi:hypothetical protein
MANETQNPNKSVQAAEGFLMELKKRAEDAHKANDVFMMGLMTDMIKVTSPIVTRAINRYHREERARIGKLHRELRQNMPKPSGQSEKSAPNATRNLGS